MNITHYLQQQLNEEQFQAAVHTDTSSLILAGAGSGKTRTLTYKIAYLIFEKKIKPFQILAVTFTNKAAKEMKERLVHISQEIHSAQQATQASVSDFDDLLDLAMHQASQGFDEMQDYKWIGTFHGVFLKFLKEEIKHADMGYTQNFGVYDDSESMSVIKDVLKQLNMADDMEPREVRSFISKLKGQGMTSEIFTPRINGDYDQTMGMIYHKYETQLKQSNALDFDDLLLMPYLILKKHPEILHRRQEKFRYIMVDEAQDTNWIQFELMKLLSGTKGNITFIGDDYQSIYRRRGAVMENFLNLKRIWPDIQTFKLETNYRSRAHIVHAGNHIIKKNTKQYDKTIKPHRQGEEKIIVFGHGDEMDEALNLVNLMKKLKSEKQKQWGDFAILYRTNAQSAPFEQVLLQESIPYKVFGGFKFFERKEVKDILSYIKYLINPQDAIALKRIINVPKRKIGPDSVAKVEEYALANQLGLGEVIEHIEQYPTGVNSGTSNAIKQFGTMIKFIKSQIELLKPSQILEQLLSHIKYKDYLITTEGQEAGEEKYDNIGQLINMTSKYDQMGIAGLQQFMDEVSLMTDIEEDKDGSMDAVKMMTVHSSKGLEFPVVFVVGLEEGIFPLQKAKFEADEMEEERRLMYVAITRAKDHLFLSHATSRKQRGQVKYNAPSRFIEELPEEIKKLFDMAGSGYVDMGPSLEEGDYVRHKLFGLGEVVEVWKDLAIVRFQNAKFGIRKIENRYLTKV